MTGNEHRVCATYLHDHRLLWWLYPLLEGSPINSSEEWLFSDTVEWRMAVLWHCRAGRKHPNVHMDPLSRAGKNKKQLVHLHFLHFKSFSSTWNASVLILIILTLLIISLASFDIPVGYFTSWYLILCRSLYLSGSVNGNLPAVMAYMMIPRAHQSISWPHGWPRNI